MSEWIYEGREFEPPEDFSPKTLYGFVYLIENLANGRKYIGKKLMWASKSYQLNKRKRRRKVESDWRDYFGSSEELLGDVEKYGPENFRRTILHLCTTKGECSYLEAKEQFARDALLSDEYYNSWISVKVRKSHVPHMLTE
jgi:hypothetical protein